MSSTFRNKSMLYVILNNVRGWELLMHSWKENRSIFSFETVVNKQNHSQSSIYPQLSPLSLPHHVICCYFKIPVSTLDRKTFQMWIATSTWGTKFKNCVDSQRRGELFLWFIVPNKKDESAKKKKVVPRWRNLEGGCKATIRYPLGMLGMQLWYESSAALGSVTQMRLFLSHIQDFPTLVAVLQYLKVVLNQLKPLHDLDTDVYFMAKLTNMAVYILRVLYCRSS